MRNIILCLFLLGSSLIQANEPIASLPFEIHLGHIYMKAKINNGKTINVVFDTGAGANLASEQVAEALGLKVSGSQQVSGASGPVSIKSSSNNTLWLGEDLEMKNQTFLVMNLDHLGDVDYPLDAVIGGNVLRRYVVELNFDNGLINIYERKGFTAPEGFQNKSISLVPYGIPIVEGDFIVSGSETLSGPYLVDTGAALALRLNTPLVTENELLEKISPNYAYTSRALNNSATDYIGKVNSFSILGEKFNAVPIRMARVRTGVSSWDTVDGIMGLEILKRFNLIFDYSQQAMYLQRSKLFEVPFKNNTSGLKLKKRSGFLEVESIIEGSAGAKAKFQIGDEIISVDGQKNMTYDEFKGYTQAKKVISLEVMRDGEKLTLQLKPFSMI